MNGGLRGLHKRERMLQSPEEKVLQLASRVLWESPALNRHSRSHKLSARSEFRALRQDWQNSFP